MTEFFEDPDNAHDPSVTLVPPASWASTIGANQNFFARPPGCVVRRTATLSVGNSAWTDVPLTATDLRDTDAFHDPTSSAEQIVVPAGFGGWYDLGFHTYWQGNSSGRRFGRFEVDSTVYEITADSPSNSGLWRQSGTRFVEVPSNGVVKFQVYQDSGGSLNLQEAVVWMTLRAVP